jgi:hypothetical protein
MRIHLRWPGAGTLQDARKAIRDGNAVEIELPLEAHYTLYRGLHPEGQRGVAAEVDAEGGDELLAPIARVTGLEDLARLRAAVRRAHYRVRITSPQPVLLRLEPPARARKARAAR